VNLTLYINRAEPDPRLALVTSKTDMTRLPLPILTLGDLINLTIIGVDGNGAVSADSGATGYSPRVALGLKGHESLAVAASVAQVATDPKGWTCKLDLDVDALTLYVRSAVCPALTLSLVVVNASTGRATWFSVDCAVQDGVGLDEDSDIIPPAPAAANTPELRQDITDAAGMIALATVGHAKPWVILSNENSGWTAWTLVDRSVDYPDDATIAADDPDGNQYRIPADADPVSNFVLWVKTAIS
jgi:hypothetical protein